MVGASSVKCPSGIVSCICGCAELRILFCVHHMHFWRPADMWLLSVAQKRLSRASRGGEGRPEWRALDAWNESQPPPGQVTSSLPLIRWEFKSQLLEIGGSNFHRGFVA